MTDLSRIRNFSIVAHIDHGKSTLADRLIQLTGTVAERDMKEQMLDSMDIERERGITIKANTVRIEYPAKDGHTYILNLIDTPGHVDFAYEVSRSMRPSRARCWWSTPPRGRGADARQCLPGHRRRPRDRARPQQDRPARRRARPRQAEQIEDVIGIDASDAIEISAKTGLGIPDVLEAIVTRLPAPQGRPRRAAQGDAGRQLVRPLSRRRRLIRVIDGVLKKGDRIRMMQTGGTYPIDRSASSAPPCRTSPSSARARSASHRLDQAGPRHPRGRHDHP
jgi:GTP-binding protein LepA